MQYKISTKGNKWKNIKGFSSNLVAQIGYIKVSKPSLLRGVTKKGGCIIKQHPDLLYGSKRPCDVWAPGTTHEHWSFPSYFVSEHACGHFVLNNQTQLLRIQIGQDRISETNAHISHTQISQRMQASRLQNTQ